MQFHQLYFDEEKRRLWSKANVLFKWTTGKYWTISCVEWVESLNMSVSKDKEKDQRDNPIRRKHRYFNAYEKDLDVKLTVKNSMNHKRHSLL